MTVAVYIYAANCSDQGLKISARMATIHETLSEDATTNSFHVSDDVSTLAHYD